MTAEEKLAVASVLKLIMDGVAEVIKYGGEQTLVFEDAEIRIKKRYEKSYEHRELPNE